MCVWGGGGGGAGGVCEECNIMTSLYHLYFFHVLMATYRVDLEKRGVLLRFGMIPTDLR